jgi:hypothetical protein
MKKPEHTCGRKRRPCIACCIHDLKTEITEMEREAGRRVLLNWEGPSTIVTMYHAKCAELAALEKQDG